MKPKLLPFLILAITSALGCFTTLPTLAQEKPASEKLLARTKISRAEAEKIALKAVPDATMKEAELEEEDGGLRWSFDLKITGSKKITEVGVDAITGKIVENHVENEKDEAKEQEKDDKGKKEKDKDAD